MVLQARACVCYPLLSRSHFSEFMIILEQFFLSGVAQGVYFKWMVHKKEDIWCTKSATPCEIGNDIMEET